MSNSNRHLRTIQRVRRPAYHLPLIDQLSTWVDLNVTSNRAEDLQADWTNFVEETFHLTVLTEIRKRSLGNRCRDALRQAHNSVRA